MGEACIRVAAVVRPPTRLEGISGFVPQQISLFSRSGGDSRGVGAGGKHGRPLVPLGSVLDGLKLSFQTGETGGGRAAVWVHFLLADLTMPQGTWATTVCGNDRNVAESQRCLGCLSAANSLWWD